MQGVKIVVEAAANAGVKRVLLISSVLVTPQHKWVHCCKHSSTFMHCIRLGSHESPRCLPRCIIEVSPPQLSNHFLQKQDTHATPAQQNLQVSWRRNHPLHIMLNAVRWKLMDRKFDGRCSHTCIANPESVAAPAQSHCMPSRPVGCLKRTAQQHQAACLHAWTEFICLHLRGCSHALPSCQAGENALRKSGVPYTIVRPGRFVEKPGKAAAKLKTGVRQYNLLFVIDPLSSCLLLERLLCRTGLDGCPHPPSI